MESSQSIVLSNVIMTLQGSPLTLGELSSNPVLSGMVSMIVGTSSSFLSVDLADFVFSFDAVADDGSTCGDFTMQTFDVA